MTTPVTQQKDPSRSITMLTHDTRIDRRILDQARSLQSDGWAVTIIASPLEAGESCGDTLSYPDLEIVRISEERTPKLMHVIGENRLFQLISWFPDHPWFNHYNHFFHFLLEALTRPSQVYVGHDLLLMPFAVMAAAANGAYVVYDSHESFPYQESHKIDHTLHYLSTERDFVRYLDKITTVNQSTAVLLRERYQLPFTPSVLLNAPSRSTARNPTPEIGKLIHHSLGLPHDKKILLYQGGIVSRGRSLDKIISAMKFVHRNDVVLVLMGPDCNARDLLSEQAQREGTLFKRVFFHDAVPQQELLAYSAAADVGIIPYPPVDLNTLYCTPNKMFEFIAAELPIMANDLPELQRFVTGQGIGKTYRMQSSRDIAQAIDDFFASDLDAYRTTCGGISARFTWEAQEEYVQALYSPFKRKDRVPQAFLQTELYLAAQAILRGDENQGLERLRRLIPIVQALPENAYPSPASQMSAESSPSLPWSERGELLSSIKKASTP